MRPTILIHLGDDPYGETFIEEARVGQTLDDVVKRLASGDFRFKVLDVFEVGSSYGQRDRSLQVCEALARMIEVGKPVSDIGVAFLDWCGFELPEPPHVRNDFIEHNTLNPTQQGI